MSIRFERGKYIIDYYPNGRKGKRVRCTLPEGTTEEEAHKIEEEKGYLPSSYQFRYNQNNVIFLF